MPPCCCTETHTLCNRQHTEILYITHIFFRGVTYLKSLYYIAKNSSIRNKLFGLTLFEAENGPDAYEKRKYHGFHDTPSKVFPLFSFLTCTLSYYQFNRKRHLCRDHFSLSASYQKIYRHIRDFLNQIGRASCRERVLSGV